MIDRHLLQCDLLSLHKLNAGYHRHLGTREKPRLPRSKHFYQENLFLKSVEFSTKFPSLNLPFVRTDPFFNKPFPFIGLALGGVFGRDGLHEPVDHIGFDQIVRESGMLVVDSFD